METDEKWSNNLIGIENYLPNNKLIPLDNLYGMNFYTNLEIVHHKVHYFISLERPTLEMHLIDQKGKEFVFFGFHPPPPSPTEKTTSKEKDGELILLARRVREIEKPVLIAGDFNNVCWSSITKMFCKISNLQDGRISNGFKSTFPAKHPFLRYPLDLLFFSKNIRLTTIDTLAKIGSDHFPLFASFSDLPDETKTQKEKEFIEEADEIVQDGKEEAHNKNDSDH